MAPRDGDYQSGSDFVSPTKAQQLGNFDTAKKRYADTVDRFGHNESTVVGMPNIGGGLDGVMFPKAWVGADSIHNLDVINTVTLSSKIGNVDLTARGGVAIANLAVDVFPQGTYDPFVNVGGNTSGDPGYNYVINKGDVDAGTGDVAKIGNGLDIDAVGKDAIVEGTLPDTTSLKRWERNIRFTPDTITPASEVFIISKGHGSSANCEWAISYDSTSIYRTIGGAKVAVGATATYMTAGEECYMRLINLGDTASGVDSFGFNDVLLRDAQAGNRGSVSSNRKEMVGGIFPTDDDTGASISNALGHYRQFGRFNAERLINPEIIAYQCIAGYQNYKTAIVIMWGGDSNVNGYGGPRDVNNRGLSFPFLVESKLISLGYDVLTLNRGVGGTAYGSLVPSDIYETSILSPDALTSNTTYPNSSRACKEFLIDMYVCRSGSNDYAFQTGPIIPYTWSDQLHQLSLIAMECARYSIPLIYNTTGNNSNPTEPYTLDSKEDAALGILARAGANCVDTHTPLRDPVTLVGYDWAFVDDVHLSLRGCELTANLFIKPILKYVASSKISFPETA